MYNNQGGNDPAADPAMPQAQRPREKSHEPIDTSVKLYENKRNGIKSAQQAGSNERPQTLN